MLSTLTKNMGPLFPIYQRSISSLFIICTTKRYSKSTDNQRVSLKNVKSSEKNVKKVRFYILDRYSYYLDKYEKILEKRLPKAMKIYRVFVDGTKNFFTDFKEFISMYKSVNFDGNDIRTFPLKKIELYDQMPRDMLKIAPVLLVSALPLTNYIILPLAYYFPKYLLTNHFWTLQQKTEFRVHFLRKRLLHNRPIFRHLQLQLPNLKSHPLHKRWSHVLGQIGSGVHPNVDEILECQQLFQDEPYHLYYISGNHIKHLIKLHDLHLGFLRRSRLEEKASIIQAMDEVIIKEGGVDKMGIESLRSACFIRGLNPINVSEDCMKKWLCQWTEISQNLHCDAKSLLLHCPILLGYNEPSNWRLLYPVKDGT